MPITLQNYAEGKWVAGTAYRSGSVVCSLRCAGRRGLAATASAKHRFFEQLRDVERTDPPLLLGLHRRDAVLDLLA